MNDLINKKNHYNTLFAYYQNLLTKKQQDIFKSYYEDDYSLSEISEELQISRNAVFDTLNKVTKLLDEYEEKLHLVEKEQQRHILYEQYENEATIELITKLKEME